MPSLSMVGKNVMFNQNQDSVTISADIKETADVKKLEQILESSDSHPRLIGSNGEIVLPEPIYQALCKVVRAISEGKTISFAPIGRELSSEEAAEILGVSRPYLVNKLLKPGEIPHVKVGNRHRIQFKDVMLYKQSRDQERRQTLKEFTEFLQDEGFYDE